MRSECSPRRHHFGERHQAGARNRKASLVSPARGKEHATRRASSSAPSMLLGPTTAPIECEGRDSKQFRTVGRRGVAQTRTSTGSRHAGSLTVLLRRPCTAVTRSLRAAFTPAVNWRMIACNSATNATPTVRWHATRLPDLAETVPGSLRRTPTSWRCSRLRRTTGARGVSCSRSAGNASPLRRGCCGSRSASRRGCWARRRRMGRCGRSHWTRSRSGHCVLRGPESLSGPCRSVHE